MAWQNQIAGVAASSLASSISLTRFILSLCHCLGDVRNNGECLKLSNN